MVQHGIHHVTAICGDARRTLDFYAGRLGLRLVKKTVNFDDPGTYHLYFGDEDGAPGTILTFFSWPDTAAAGRAGVGEVGETMFRIPVDAVGDWAARLGDLGVERVTRFGAPVLRFRDPDGMRLALVGVPGLAGERGWDAGGVPATEAIRGLHGVSVVLAEAEATAAVISDVFGFRREAAEGDAVRFTVPGTGVGGVVELRTVAGTAPARLGRGSVHHLAFRAADDAAQAGMVAALARGHGLHTTAQKDRDYFRSVYVREPGGVLFEIATDVPGFAVDEDPAALGTALKLPRFLDGRRAQIEAVLPPLG